MLADKFRLDGKVAIVTGASRGMGECIGLTYAEAGANVVFAARTEKDIQANVEKAKAFGVQAIAVPCDVNDEGQLQVLADKTIENFGKIDIVVNVAGGALPNQIANTSREKLHEAFDFNVAWIYSFIRICLPHLQASKGCVISISSAAGHIVQPNFSVYGTVKAALDQMTRMLASDLAPDVRVNAIAPGSIMTDALKMFLDEAALQKMSDLTPMKRLGESEDIAMGALYLASPAASWVTGKVLEVDGGMVTTNMPF
ncbi:MAG: glucose 1-dehydrogenase [Chloroflexi bacterium]|nr:glucose 1-dehydrogenase [Chloroflexota bacterium]